jgi:hypothetical protein
MLTICDWLDAQTILGDIDVSAAVSMQRQTQANDAMAGSHMFFFVFVSAFHNVGR